MKLFSFFNSSASYRVRIALALKGIEFDLEPVNIRTGDQWKLSYRAFAPAGLVPALLEQDGWALSQSLAIIDYLESTYPDPPLYPKAARERALALEIANVIACDIHPINNLRVLRYLTDVVGVTAEQKTAWYAHWIDEGLRAVENMLAGSGAREFCVGGTPGIADCCLVPQWANAERMGCDLSAFTLCGHIVERCRELPAFKAAEPAMQPDFIA